MLNAPLTTPKLVTNKFVVVALPTVILPKLATVAAKFVLVAEVKIPLVAVKFVAAILVEVALTAKR